MKALLISRDTQLYAEIASQGAARVPPLNVAAHRASLRDALDRPLTDAPDLIVVDITDVDAADGDLLERLTRHYAAAHFMLLTDNHHPDLLIRAMRAGVREVLQLPLDHRALHEAIDRVAASAGVAAPHDGKILAFIACKGGSGATFISTNFGYALATLADKKVLLIDLHRQFGDATLYVSDQKPAMTLSDVCQQIARIDGPFLESCLVHVAPGFGVLAAADDPGQTIIVANPDLQERELTKLAGWARVMGEGLRRREVAEPAASLAAETGVAVFRVAFEQWIAGPPHPTLAATLRDAFDRLREVAGQP